MNKTPKTDALFAEVEALYPTQLYHRGDYCAKVRALHELLSQMDWRPRWPFLTIQGTITHRLTT